MSEFDTEQFRADLAVATFAELRLCADIVAAEIADREQAAVREVRDQILALAAGVGRSVEELLSATAPKPRKEKSSAPVKYVDPTNPDNTWSGRGKRPTWLRHALEDGAELESFAVSEAA